MYSRVEVLAGWFAPPAPRSCTYALVSQLFPPNFSINGNKESDTDLLVNQVETLGHDHHPISRNTILLDRLAEDPFTRPHTVDIGGVPCRHTTIIRRFEDWQRFLLIKDPRRPSWVAKGHAPENGDGDL